MSIKIDELTFENIGVWPTSIMVGCLVLLFLLILFLGFWFQTRDQLVSLNQLKKEHIELSQQLQAKQQQLQELQSKAKKSNTKSSSTTNPIKNLVTIGEKNGLQFKFVNYEKPGKVSNFDNDLISIDVLGDYFQLTDFLEAFYKQDNLFEIKQLTIAPQSQKSKNDLATKKLEMLAKIDLFQQSNTSAT